MKHPLRSELARYWFLELIYNKVTLMNLVSCDIEIVANFMTLNIDYFIDDMSNTGVIPNFETVSSGDDSIKLYLPVLMFFYLSQLMFYAA